MKKAIRQLGQLFTQEASAQGADLDGPELTGGRHLRWRVSGPQGTRKMITALTPSDRRAVKNQICVLRRLCREVTND